MRSASCRATAPRASPRSRRAWGRWRQPAGRLVFLSGGKAALNQLVHTAAIEIARTHPQAVVVCLHPGTVATRFTEKYLGSHPAVPPETAAANLLSVLDRLTPADSGGFFDAQGKAVPW